MPMIIDLVRTGSINASGAPSGALFRRSWTSLDATAIVPAHGIAMTLREQASTVPSDPAAILARITADLAQLGQSLAARPAPAAIEAVRPRLLYTVEEAADRLSLSRSALYELIRAGEIASVKVGGRRRITQTALDTYVAGLIPTEPPAAAS